MQVYCHRVTFRLDTLHANKGNNKLPNTAIFQRERQNSQVNKQIKSVNNRETGKTAMAPTWYRHLQRNGG